MSGAPVTRGESVVGGGFTARREAVVGRQSAQGRGSGQATVELVAFLPLLLAAGVAGAAFLAAHAAGEHAGSAAEAGAVALLQGGDPRAAARKALPASVRDEATIAVAGRRITVRVRPDLPVEPVARRLEAEATADAGPEPSP
jgi:hypothetical protein